MLIAAFLIGALIGMTSPNVKSTVVRAVIAGALLAIIEFVLLP